ncbi:hypothetical protein Fleli_0036 [Bernardetia litoralis DSM 6794]|uniref:Sulfatase-modifying factor enzyme-like domain-containing protein n=1 Tax=Bernardetia litoralis (strain ATCC 23117 / DSM 6794 / NBRC 15988 / NCIMB 1366 / Fx l1 / Sio-4) TaxID=880071 RepID=I4AF12_BERLS|nr:SUMF1/EgtB/PvdO family nonheme iron enzyme [Bernardetia litoralis]AFM02547.1 hypothetical protein Fleli_0036 [Bernardetia litoralis DSM 6794]
MKNIFFVVFLFLPFLSYSQIVSHSFKDSVLTVFIKPTTLNSEADTIYPIDIPKKINFVFEDVDSTDFYSKQVVMVRGRRLIGKPTIDKNIYTIIPYQHINWEGDRFVICVRILTKNTLDTLGFCTNLYIIPPPTLAKMQLPPKQRDSVERLEMHIELLNYSRENFEELKQPQENLTNKDRRNIEKLYKNITESSKHELGSNSFFYNTEVSNYDWLNYLEDTERNYLRLSPALDSSVFRELYGDSIFDNSGLLYTEYAYLPVTGITYEQAQAYCIWKENEVSEYLNKEQKKKYKDYKITVCYRLPTKEEWEYAAINNDLNKKFGGYSTKRRYTEKEKREIYRSAEKYSDSTRTLEEVKLDMKNYFESDTSYKRMFNYKVNYQNPYFIQKKQLFKEGIIMNWIFDYKPTKQFELYNMFGNVAEMTSEKGIAKGGSFAHTLEECAADRVQVYNSPQAWLGFRCVAEVVVRKREWWEMPTELQRFQYSRGHQENLTDEDKKKIAKIYSKLKLSDGVIGKLNDYKKIEYTKVTNTQWMEYLSFLLKDSVTEQYLNALPDTMIWNKFYQNGTVDYHFLRNPAYKDFPVVGITYEQAQNYCIWRGDMDTKSVNEKQRKKYKDYELILSYKLPTQEEWEYAVPKYDLNKESKSKVAEMTSEKGIAKGGSFAHTLEECAADKVQVYDSPQAWLGFRCVAEVVVRKKERK